MIEEDRTEILLVEDNPDDAEMTLHALSQKNITGKVKHLKNGVEALDFVFARKDFSNNKIQKDLKLVILDLKLPKLDGLEVLRKIREDERTCHLPVIILTSSREKRDIIQAYKLGVNSYVVKPVEFNQYVTVVNTLGIYWDSINEKPISQKQNEKPKHL